MNKPSSLISRLLSPDPLLFWAYALPLLYWAYLTLTTHLVLVFDSEGYFYWGNAFFHGQWLQYFQDGPTREPGYPLMITTSLLLGKWLSIDYTYPLKIISFGMLLSTMIIIQQILKFLKANRCVVAATIFYTGMSPILINSALCMYSEIATFPWLVGAVLSSFYFLKSLEDTQQQNFKPAVALSFCLLGFTFVKGLGEELGTVFLCWLLCYAWLRSRLNLGSFLRRAKLKIFLLLCIFFVPLLGFRTLNFAFNGHFAFTNRGDLASYGPMLQRAQSPITLTNALIHLSTVPVSYPLCSNFFPAEKCSYWSKSPDMFYAEVQAQFDAQNLSRPQREKAMSQLLLKTAMSHPFRQVVYIAQEGLKMFFWETSQGPFVVYPPRLENLFNDHRMVLVMSLGAGGFCLLGFFTACFLINREPILITLAMTVVLVCFFSLFNVISRYAIIAGPLSILLNASCLAVLTHRFSDGKKTA